MAGRKKRLAKDAKPVTIYLTPEERMALQVIELRRSKRSEERDSPSEIVSDALWKFLADVEGVPQAQIEALLPKSPKHQLKSNIRRFPRKESH